MDELLSDQIEWLLSCNFQGNRLAPHLIIITGCLAGNSLPEHINKQMAALSRQTLLQEILDSLINSLNQFSKSSSFPQTKPASSSTNEPIHMDLTKLIEQVGEARQQLLQCDPVNYAELIAWIASQAREQKLWSKTRRR